MQCIVNGRIVGYDSIGKGKTVLLLHGWGANRRSLDTIASDLSSRFLVLNVDVPGFGESEKPEKPWGVGDYAEWVPEFTSKLGVKDMYAVVGHSNGGAIAIKLASSGYPLQKLVLLGASGIRKRQFGKKLLYKAISKTGKAATVALPKKLKLKVRSAWYKQIGSELYHAPGMEASFKKVTSEDLRVDAAMISSPTLLVYGSNDDATPPLFGRMYHEAIEHSTLTVIEGAGHYAFVDEPTAVLTTIKEFLG